MPALLTRSGRTRLQEPLGRAVEYGQPTPLARAAGQLDRRRRTAAMPTSPAMAMAPAPGSGMAVMYRMLWRLAPVVRV
ncbi:MAG: hypothetical protein KatS3mg103_0787 [Phycisphaerales bacterium]|nr:MAG: hypothetical protein KatS3mg103_0787 [Phycisphaerales bacterium]